MSVPGRPLDGLKYYVIGGNFAIERICFGKAMKKADSLSDADVVIFQGGADVSPKLYGEKKHQSTHADERRDEWEKACYEKALKEGKIMVGICRGGQFLNVMNGGKLWQDVNNHAISGTHIARYLFKKNNAVTSRIVHVTSTHHQQIIPDCRARKCEVWCTAGISTHKESGPMVDTDKPIVSQPPKGHATDTEICFYPETRSLCFQPHPEYQDRETKDLFFECLERAIAA